MVLSKTLSKWSKMPGALQLEALAQMLTVAITTLPGNKGMVTHALSHTVRFKKEVLPGDRFIIETEVISWNRGIAKGKGVGIQMKKLLVRQIC